MTIGSATVNYPVLSNLKDDAALREMTMGMAVARTAFHREIRHFAYPFGDAASWKRRHAGMAEEAGFVSAASAQPGVVEPAGRSNLFALPRISWDGRLNSLRAMRVLLSGAMLPRSPVPVLGRRNSGQRKTRSARVGELVLEEWVCGGGSGGRGGEGQRGVGGGGGGEPKGEGERIDVVFGWCSSFSER